MEKYKYKKSGIEWLKEYPKHWSLEKLKKNIRLIPSNVDKRTEDDEKPVKLCNYVDVYYNNYIDLSIDFMEATANDNELKKFQLEKGDVIITKDSEDPDDIAVPAFVRDTEENLLCGYHLSILRANDSDLSGKFLFWALKDYPIVSQLHREATGITRWAIGAKHIKNTQIPLPPLSEQKAIANYLDTASQKIDQVIKIKEDQIKKIDDYLFSKINEYITGKNLSDGTIKFSGDKLSGTIPDGWRVKRLKQITSKINSGVTPDGGAESYVDEGIPLIRSQNVTFQGLNLEDVAYITPEIHKDMSNSQVQNGDVLLNITGASMGRCFYVKEMNEVNVNQHVCIIRPRYQILTKYLYYFLMSSLGQAQVFSGYTGSGREGLNFQAIKNFRIPLPEIQTQKETIEILDSLSAKVDTQKKIISDQIDIIKAYKKSLIHECITGKKKVFKGEIEEPSKDKVMA